MVAMLVVNVPFEARLTVVAKIPGPLTVTVPPVLKPDPDIEMDCPATTVVGLTVSEAPPVEVLLTTSWVHADRPDVSVAVTA